MDIKDAFPVCKAKVFVEGEEDKAEVYTVMALEGGRLRLQALSSELKNEPPQVGEPVVVRATQPHRTYLARGRVIERETGDRVNLILEREGEIERVERRQNDRMATRIPVRIEILTGSPTGALALRTEDVNSRGMRVVSPCELAMGTSARVALDFGGETSSVSCRGNVVWCHRANAGRFGIGICFTDISDDDRERIVTALLRRMLIADEPSS